MNALRRAKGYVTVDAEKDAAMRAYNKFII